MLEKESAFIRFHALQSTITFGVFFVLSLFFSFIPFVGWAFNLIIFLLSLITWIICMIKAYQGEMFKLPVVGDIAAKQGP